MTTRINVREWDLYNEQLAVALDVLAASYEYVMKARRSATAALSLANRMGLSESNMSGISELEFCFDIDDDGGLVKSRIDGVKTAAAARRALVVWLDEFAERPPALPLPGDPDGAAPI